MRDELRSGNTRGCLEGLDDREPGVIDPHSMLADQFGKHIRKSSLNHSPREFVACADTAVDETWHTEANVQAAGVTALASKGWRILSVANTATKEHGIDVGRWFLSPQFDGQRCGPGWICGGSGFLAGAAVGHHLGVIGVDLTRRAGLVIA